MAFIEYGGKRHVVPAGDMLIGTGADCHLRLEAPGVALRHAVLTTAPDQSVSIRRLASEAVVEVNGVVLGALPQPLLHGDKVTVGGVDLLFVDERKSGSTQYVSAVEVAKLMPPSGAPKSAAAGKPTGTTGGRVVSLTDGREYQIVGASLKFGRDATSDVVVSGGQVSRRHCEIMTTPRGYVIVDSSTNGTFVNSERVQGQRLLARADVIRIAEEEFRFYADVAAGAPAPPAASAPPPPPAAVPPAPAVSPPAAPPGTPQLASTGYFPAGTRPQAPGSPRTGEEMPLPEEFRGQPAAPPAPPVPPAPPRPQPVAAPPAPAPPVVAAPPAAPVPPRPAAAAPPASPVAPKAPPVAAAPPPPAAPATPKAPAAATPAAAAPPAAPPAAAKAPTALAKFLVRSGSLKGQRLLVKVPIVNIGRADYNDLVIPDDSVSSQHAKLMRREGVWILTDLGSTNGTMVDGERVSGDAPISPGSFVRFGDVQLIFEPTDDDAGVKAPAGTRAISAIKLTDLKPPQGR
jgi:pSer/pThr/pTyr-binding forkhead associated (FHA) protein